MAPGDIVGKMSLKHPDKDAIIEGSTHWSWKQLLSMRNRAADALKSQHGLKAGDAVLIYGKNSATWMLARLTCAVMRLQMGPLNWHLSPSEVAYVVGSVSPKAVFFDPAFADHVSRLRQQNPGVVWVSLASPTNWPAPFLASWRTGRDGQSGASG